MADSSTTTAPRGGRIRRGFFELVDRLALNNRGFNYGSGQWNPSGVRQGLTQTALGAVNPLLGLAAGRYFDSQRFRVSPTQLQGSPNLTPTMPGLNTATLRNYQTQPMFNPSNPFALPQQSPTRTSQSQPFVNLGAFTPRLSQPGLLGAGFQSRLGNSAGGARGVHSQGGLTGDAARAFMESMRGQPMVMGNQDYLA